MLTKVRISAKDKEILKKLKKHLPRKRDVQDYSRFIVQKPWGYEYPLFQNGDVSIWFLHIKHGSQTSMHCHPLKKTSIVILSGEVQCSSLHQEYFLPCGHGVFLDKGVFHSTKSLSSDGVFLLEIETPVDKANLLRFTDAYGRENMGYEGTKYLLERQRSVYYSFLDESGYIGVEKQLGSCKMKIFRFENADELQSQSSWWKSSIVAVLKGQLVNGTKRTSFTTGDVFLGDDIYAMKHLHISSDLELLYIKKGVNI